MTQAARKYRVMTQMGNQGHSGDGVRDICEWIWNEAIGDVREVHAWTNRPVWPRASRWSARRRHRPSRPVWIGTGGWPRTLSPLQSRLPSRKLAGLVGLRHRSLGDLGCHILDAPFWALKLKYPISVEGCISTYWHDLWKETKPRNETYPRSTIVAFQVPRSGGYAGRQTDLVGRRHDAATARRTRTRPADRRQRRRRPVPGTKGTLMCGCYGRNPQLPRIAHEGLQPPAKDAGPHSRGQAATSETGSAPARTVSPPARTSTIPAPCPKPYSWATLRSVTRTVSCSGTARRWK